jgi:hypothetical protein
VQKVEGSTKKEKKKRGRLTLAGRPYPGVDLRLAGRHLDKVGLVLFF